MTLVPYLQFVLRRGRVSDADQLLQWCPLTVQKTGLLLVTKWSKHDFITIAPKSTNPFLKTFTYSGNSGWFA